MVDQKIDKLLLEMKMMNDRLARMEQEWKEFNFRDFKYQFTHYLNEVGANRGVDQFRQMTEMQEKIRMILTKVEGLAEYFAAHGQELTNRTINIEQMKQLLIAIYKNTDELEGKLVGEEMRQTSDKK